MKQVQ